MESPKDEAPEKVEAEATNEEEKGEAKNEKKSGNPKKNKRKNSMRKAKKKASLSSKNGQRNYKKMQKSNPASSPNSLPICPPPPPPPPPPPSMMRGGEDSYKFGNNSNMGFLNICSMPGGSGGGMGNSMSGSIPPPNHQMMNPSSYHHSMSMGPPGTGLLPPMNPRNVSHNPNINIKTENVNLSSMSNCNMNMNSNFQSNVYYSNTSKKKYKVNNVMENDAYVSGPTLRPAPYHQNSNAMSIHVEKRNMLMSNSYMHQSGEYSYMQMQHHHSGSPKKKRPHPSMKKNYANMSLSANPNYYVYKPPGEAALSKVPTNDYGDDKLMYASYPNSIEDNNMPKYYEPRSYGSDPNINMWGGTMGASMSNVPYDNSLANMKYPMYDQGSEKMKFKYRDKMARMSNQSFDSKPHNIIVTNIPKNLSSGEILETFRFMGNILRADIMLTSTGEHSGCACLTFPDFESASFAASNKLRKNDCRYDGGMLNNQKIKMFVE
ncbi:hypothetical protein C922_02532 [Plasmodium inui San Antonio 1]|uniref:RRM domain-containing protein n=1 Tax=Plasmodium inui San Antonio 1 TaxID=1237626 RepID=W7A6T8_9APIC|nr:hypothetical protein C922_02532 [Plasmodium inui San Antonio 1]EUD66948.1 hypothetical protein C922_02532 [Plasmodium inui San Antonio 1]